MAKTDASVEDLVGMIERGELRLPEMQRQYVWQATRVRDLMDSLYRGYPSGAILVWETDDSVPQRDFAVQQERNSYQSTKLLLDGQQRLTSLSAVLRGQPIQVRWRKRPVELLFNLEHPDKLTFVTEVNETAEEDFADDITDAGEDVLEGRLKQMTFIIATKKLQAMPNWVNVSDVFGSHDNGPFLKKAGVTGFDDPRYEKFNQRLNRLRSVRNYSYRMDILERTLSYEEVTEIFVRVNSLGAKLRSSDLAMAQITAKWQNSLKIFEQFQKECADLGYPLELGIHVKNLVAFVTGQSRFHTVARLTVEELQSGWKQAKEGMRFAINFLKSNIGIESPALLSSPFHLIAIGYLGHQKQYRLTAAEEADLRYWLLVANTKGRYSRGSTETFLDQDLNRIAKDQSIAALVETLRLQFGRLDIEPGDLEGRNSRSAYFKTMFLAFRQDEAKDWTSNLTISLAHSGKEHKLEFHHIFPRAVLKNHYQPPMINDMANLAFISGKTNRYISKKSPQQYVPFFIKEQGTQTFAAQCIPTGEELLTVDAFPQFLAARRQLIADRLNRFLQHARGNA